VPPGMPPRCPGRAGSEGGPLRARRLRCAVSVGGFTGSPGVRGCICDSWPSNMHETCTPAPHGTGPEIRSTITRPLKARPILGPPGLVVESRVRPPSVLATVERSVHGDLECIRRAATSTAAAAEGGFQDSVHDMASPRPSYVHVSSDHGLALIHRRCVGKHPDWNDGLGAVLSRERVLQVARDLVVACRGRAASEAHLPAPTHRSAVFACNG
jgi:hypothetical protein